MRKTIVIVGIIMAFILGTLVSAPSVTAVPGEPFVFMQEEIDAINDLIMQLQNENRILHFEQTDLVIVPSTIRERDLIVLAKWEIVKDSTFTHDIRTILYDTSVYGNVQQTSPGFSAAITGWFKSQDGMPGTWKSIISISAETTTFDVKAAFDFQNDIRSIYNFIAFGTTNPDDGINTSAGEVKDFSGTMTIHLPPGQSLVKLP